MGLRKVLLAFAMLLSVVTPAKASEPCALWERQVYAITTEGGLVEHMFCLDANRVAGMTRWGGERVIATSGWGDVSTAFWSGDVHGGGVYYRVVGSGLFWSADLQTWRQIRRGTDWSGFTSLISSEPGVIYGTEPSGAVRRWVHVGWQNGLDRWGDDSMEAALPARSRLLGYTGNGFVGVDSTDPSDIVNVWLSNFITNWVRMAVPPGVDRDRLVPFDLEQRYLNSAFGLTAAGKVVVLLPIGCKKFMRAWKADDETGSGGYRYIFAGGYGRPRGAGPVEWQCGGSSGPGAN